MHRYYIGNQQGMRVGVLDYGALLTCIELPLKAGGHHNAILSYPDVEDYQQDAFYLGATIGRYANRINKGTFRVDEKDVQLSLNENANQNHLHGGFSGFNTKIWEVLAHDESSITLSYFSKNGEEGYPGNVQTTITYKVEEENTLSISFDAQSDAPTILNLSNHCYFNLADQSRSIQDHELQVFATDYTPLDDRHIPFGAKQPVEHSVFDLREAKPVGQVMNRIINANYCIDSASGGLKDMARLTDPDSQRSLLIQASYPGLQVYFGNFLERPFLPCEGICLEPQFYPDSPNQRTFPSPYLAAGEQYQHQITYSFFNF